MAGQTINDRLLAARHSLAGQGLAKSVCKATTEEMIGPKKKHLDYLVQCTNEPNVSIPQLANLLIERSQNTNWIVVYKALITVHHMMCYGNERFTQYLASSNSTFQLSNFLDKSGLQGIAGAKIGYDMSPFIRRYARYLNEKALSYRTVAFDFCKVKRGKEDGALRTMNAEKLLKTLPTLQNQLDALLEFDCTANNLTNGVINVCFMLLFRDLIRLFACYNDGVINLLEKYFDMNKKQCREALDLYKKFLTRMDRVAEFLKVAENVGIDKGDIPDLTKAPSSLLDALEQHLAAVEGKKSTTTTPTQAASNQRNIRSGVTALSSTSNSFGTAATNGRLDGANGIDESLKQQVLAEEEAAMNQYKSKVQTPNSATNPFLSSPVNNAGPPVPPVDLFAPPMKQESAMVKASDDLLQLSNPFADVFGQPVVAPIQNNAWITNGNGFAPQVAAPPPMAFVSEKNFTTVFGSTETSTSAAIDTNVTGSALSNPFLSDLPEPPSLLLDAEVPNESSQPSHSPVQNQPPVTQPSIIDFFSNDLPDAPNLDNVLPPTQSPVPAKTPTESEQKESKEPKIDPNSIMFDLKASDASLKGENAMKDDGKSAENLMRKTVPPPRPPPPLIQAQVPSVTSPVVPVNTSSLDGLNQSLMMALGSPPGVVPTGETLPPTIGDIPPIGTASSISDKQDLLLTGFDSLGGVLQPSTSQGMSSNSVSKSTQQSQSSALLTGDLESSLASLAENLSINNRAAPVKGVQWNSPKNGAKPGSAWTPQPMAATTGVGYRPMGQGMPTISAQPMFPPLQHMGIRPMPAGTGMMGPMTGMSAPTTAGNPLAPQQSLLFH